MDKNMTIKFEFEPRDLWIGVYWDTHYQCVGEVCGIINIWICLIPCFPIHITKYIR